MYYSEKYTFYSYRNVEKTSKIMYNIWDICERCFLNSEHMKQILYLNCFIRYKALKLLNAMIFPTEIELFDILNWKTS